MSDIPEEGITEPENLAADLTHREKTLRDHFVNEYLVDYDQKSAAIRIGYGSSYAHEMSVRLMQCPYVLQQISLKEANTEEEDAAIMRKRIITGLIREANFKGPGCSPSARVAALSKLAAIQGMDAPARSKLELTGADGQPLGGGMFVVPGIISVEDWEKLAMAQQTALVDSSADPAAKPAT
jgi:hypothetical protein